MTDSDTDSFTQTSNTASVGGWVLGSTYFYRLSARNVRGYGSVSTSISVITPGLPAQMAAPTMQSRTGFAIIIQWLPLTTDAQTSRTTITHYSLRCRLST